MIGGLGYSILDAIQNIKRLSSHTLRNISFFLLLFALICLAHPEKSGAITGKININTATKEELQELPFIGASKAQSILNYRKKNGPFTNLAELKELSSIGDSTFQAIEPYLMTSGLNTLEAEKSPEAKSFQVFPKVQTSPGQIIMLPDGAYYPTIMSYIQQARKDITIAMFIFKTTSSPKNKPSLLLNELIAASKRGVNVSVTLDKSNYDEGINLENGKVAKKLRKNHIKVRLDSDKKTSHAKIIIIDNRFCFVGSHNFTHSAMAYNNEYTLLVDSKPLAQELMRYVAAIQ